MLYLSYRQGKGVYVILQLLPLQHFSFNMGSNFVLMPDCQLQWMCQDWVTNQDLGGGSRVDTAKIRPLHPYSVTEFMRLLTRGANSWADEY